MSCLLWPEARAFSPQIFQELLYDKLSELIHTCDRLIAWRINLTMYYMKDLKAERVPVTPIPSHGTNIALDYIVCVEQSLGCVPCPHSPVFTIHTRAYTRLS